MCNKPLTVEYCSLQHNSEIKNSISSLCQIIKIFNPLSVLVDLRMERLQIKILELSFSTNTKSTHKSH